MTWFVAAALVLALPSTAFSGDWPRWNGPRQDALTRETGLLPTWLKGGPEELWRVDGLGRGWSSPSIVGERIYITGLVDEREVVFAYSLDGELTWRADCGPGFTGSHKGARCQPTWKDGRLYVITSSLQVWCLEAATGEEVWSVDARKRFDGKISRFGHAESPLVVEDKVIVTPGGSGGSIAALRTSDGQTAWVTRGLTEMSSYCAPTLIERGGRKIIATMLKEHLYGIDAADGTVLWRHGHRNYRDNHINSPLYKDGRVFIVSGYGGGCKMFRLSEDGKELTKLWERPRPDTCHGGVIWEGGHIYGSSHYASGGGGEWICLDDATGEVLYQRPWVKMGSVAWAEGKLYCYGEDGVVALVRATPEAKQPISTFRIEAGQGEHWAHPVISGGRLYIRHGGVLLCYDIRLDRSRPAPAPGSPRRLTPPDSSGRRGGARRGGGGPCTFPNGPGGSRPPSARGIEWDMHARSGSRAGSIREFRCHNARPGSRPGGPGLCGTAAG